MARDESRNRVFLSFAHPKRNIIRIPDAYNLKINAIRSDLPARPRNLDMHLGTPWPNTASAQCVAPDDRRRRELFPTSGGCGIDGAERARRRFTSWQYARERPGPQVVSDSPVRQEGDAEAAQDRGTRLLEVRSYRQGPAFERPGRSQPARLRIKPSATYPASRNNPNAMMSAPRKTTSCLALMREIFSGDE